MQCPKCFETIKYKERTNNRCPKCSASFTFEPKYHPLQLTDVYFSKTCDKLSGNGKFYFTPTQLYFALSRKKIKSKASITGWVVAAIFTSIFATVINSSLIFVVVPIWILVIIAKFIYSRRNVFLPLSFHEFDYEVLQPWKSYHKHLPKMLLAEPPPKNLQTDLQGILLCEDRDTANCLVANRLDDKFGLAVTTKTNSVTKLLTKHGNLPVYVVHDASTNGIDFLEKSKNLFGGNVIDIGLRPQAVIKSKLPKLSETPILTNNYDFLTMEEIKWLKKGHYTPLFALKPERLLQYVSRQIEQRSKKIAADNSEKQAQAVGFMTWAGGK